MMLVGGINWIWVGTAAGAAVGMVYVALFVIGYNKSRVIYWLDPWADAADKGYQLSQSLITIGSGGLWGLGLGKSRQKFLFLPEEHNDFIFSIVCEELGLVGAGIIMLLFAALCIVAVVAARVVFPKEVKEELHEELEELTELGHHEEKDKQKEDGSHE
mgnify:CR=1 FL=1